MKKSIIGGIILMVVVLIGIIFMVVRGNGKQDIDTSKKDIKKVEAVYAANYREGIALEATEEGPTGMAIDSQINVLLDKKDLSVQEMEKGLEIEPAVPFNIEKIDAGMQISFKESLKKDTIYKFSYLSSTWLFQTETAFSLIGTLPRNESTYVPIDTGIELYFSHSGADVEDYFKIEPAVEGKFEDFGNTVVFLPKKLEPETVYTVTLKAGLSLQGSSETLDEAYTFSFETTYTEEAVQDNEKVYAYYDKQLNDFSTTEKIYIPFNYNVQEKGIDQTIETKVYAYSTLGDLADAMQDSTEWPGWTRFEKKEVDKKNLKEVLTTSMEIEDIEGYEGAVHIQADLEEGYYLIQSTWEGTTFQTFLQVTDLSFYYLADQEQDYFWVNDLAEQEPAQGAVVEQYGTNISAKTTIEGIAQFKHEVFDKGMFYRIAYKGKEVLAYRYNYFMRDGHEANYWRYFQTDRTLYQPADQVAFFGFLQNREDGTSPDEVTVEINENHWYYGRYNSGNQNLSLVKESVKVEGGFYEGKLTLPNLPRGGYTIEVKIGDQVITNYYVTVQDYTKPDYKMTVTKDKEAVFINEEVTYTIETSFFEGTPVAELPVHYTIYGVDYIEKDVVTDAEGKVEVRYQPIELPSQQGELYNGINAYALLPESGEIDGYGEVRIFSNDIDVNLEAKIEDGQGWIEGDVYTITLDRLNNHTAKDYSDYKDQPVANHVLQGKIIRNEWVKTEVGEVYDFINKRVRKKYEYHLEKTFVKAVTLKTDAHGQIKKAIDLPEEKIEVYYTLELNTKDLTGKAMYFEKYFNRNNENEYNYNDMSYLYIKSDKETYHIGDTMQLELLEHGKAYEAEKILLVLAQNGIKKLELMETSKWTGIFKEAYKPNIEISEIAFNGKSYRRSDSLYLDVEREDYKIDLEVKLDESKYQPGDTVTVGFEATRKEGEEVVPVKHGQVNIGLVDESLLALSEQTIDPLNSLYNWVSGEIVYYYGSHSNKGDRRYQTYAYTGDDLAWADEMSKGASDVEAISSREDFKDTAVFMTTQLDATGKGEVTFTLPDNITSWRLTAVALSSDLLAGSEVMAVDVSLPFFINPSLNKTYLVGDQPFANVAAYGSKIKSDEKVTYTLTCEAANYKTTVIGKAFEKVSLPMWTLEEGDYEIDIKARTASGLAGGYVEKIHVIRSYQQMPVSDTYVATKGLKVESTNKGMTNITFADRSKGLYLPSLYSLYYEQGKRVDQAYVGAIAGKLLVETFGLELDIEEVELDTYITYTGGVALLPYSEAVLETTIQLLPYIKGTETEVQVLNYLYSHFYGSQVKDKSQILYGLAALGEPVLLEINRRASVENLSLEDYIYLAMAYDVLGDSYMARHIYDEKISQYVQEYEFMSRVVKESDQEAIIRHTSLLLPLAASLSLEVSEGLYKYVASTYSDYYLTNLDRLRYITLKIAKATDEQPTLSYEYDGEVHEVDFDGYGARSIRLPSSKIDSFTVKEVTSDVLVVVNYDGLGTLEAPVDPLVSISRHYEAYNGEPLAKIQKDDVVKVVLDWRIDDEAIDNYYQVTDYAPSGLVPIGSNRNYRDDRMYWYRDIEGQQVRFGVQRDRENDRESLYYYARVISPGTFIVDAPIIQGNRIRDSYNLGERETLVIEP